MGLVRTGAPTSLVVTLSEAKTHLKVDYSDDDAYITALLGAAIASCENYTERSFFTQTWKLTLDKFSDPIELIRGPVASVSSVTYYDTDNVEQTVSASDYILDNSSKVSRIEPVDDWPDTYERIAAVNVTYVAGQAVDDVPEDIKSAIKLLVGHLYQNRQEVVTGMQANQLPMGAKYLLDAYKLYYVAS